MMMMMMIIIIIIIIIIITIINTSIVQKTELSFFGDVSKNSYDAALHKGL